MGSYTLIIAASIIIIISFIFGEIAKRTNVPAVLMLIFLGVGLQYTLGFFGLAETDFFSYLEVLGIVGLIMIVLEAALELELKPEKYLPIAKSFGIALLGLIFSTWAAAEILQWLIEGMTRQAAWMYATPLSILSSAIIIPSVTDMRSDKKEFHIYESTFSDILGIMLFYFLSGQIPLEGEESHGGGVLSFGLITAGTIIGSVLVAYIMIYVFQHIKSQTKLFLLIAVLLLLYAVGKDQFHLSSLIIILIFGLVIANMKKFFRGPLEKFLDVKKAHEIYENLHTITMETAFVVRTFFFVVFGLTISIASVFNVQVAMVSGLIILTIYAIRFVLLRLFVGKDILPQLFVAPRGLITVLLFYAIPVSIKVPGFDAGILLFIIIGTSLIMTVAMIWEKRRSGIATGKALANPIDYARWEAPTVEEVLEKQ